ncbi:uncharacterized protein [Euphorbia lathyris]|uniref:uncharacterized protein n=1 Tax=Euphorbia lathyris TaxID=212925 RepID=UPI0033130CB5
MEGNNGEQLEDRVANEIDHSSRFVTDTSFPTSSEAIAWAKSVAIQNGFQLTISSHKHGGKQKLIRCSRGERYRGGKKIVEESLRRKSKSKACGCKFQLRVVQSYDCSSWSIVVKEGMHSHAVYPEGHRLSIGLSPASKQIVRDMSLAKAKPSAILASIREKNPVDNPTIKHVYNYRNQLRNDGLEGRDVTTLNHTSMS